VRKAVLALFLLASTAEAKSVPGINDYGQLLAPEKYSDYCIIKDPGVSGSITIDAYTHGQVTCDKLQSIYSDAYVQIRAYLTSLNYDFSLPAPRKTLHLRILTLAELNEPDNFSQTDRRCMYDVKCSSGAFFGRTFYSEQSSNINIYVVYLQSPVAWKFSFTSTIRHELMHAILYRYRWNIFLKNEHELINNFLEWKRLQ